MRPKLVANDSNNKIKKIVVSDGTSISFHFNIILLRGTLLVAQLVEALRYKPEGRGVRFPMVSLEFFINVILPAALMALGSTQPLTEMSTRNISWG